MADSPETPAETPDAIDPIEQARQTQAAARADWVGFLERHAGEELTPELEQERLELMTRDLEASSRLNLLTQDEEKRKN